VARLRVITSADHRLVAEEGRRSYSRIVPGRQGHPSAGGDGPVGMWRVPPSFSVLCRRKIGGALAAAVRDQGLGGRAPARVGALFRRAGAGGRA
jgi:hypothetical protein